MSDQTEAQDAYAAALFARIGEAAYLKEMDIKIHDWQPTPKSCHSNAARVCQHLAGCQFVTGWFYLDFEYMTGVVQFVAHSAVRAPNGELWDVTPRTASRPYPFITSGLSTEHYVALLNSGATQLWHVLSDEDAARFGS